MTAAKPQNNMVTYISILRGINVSGHKLIKMDALRKMCGELGFSGTSTYIQSGNIVFRFKKTDAQKLSELIRKAIEKTFGFEVPVITLTKDDIQEIVRSNPFSKQKTKDPAYFHVTFLSGQPEKPRYDTVAAGDYKSDELALVNSTLYLYCPAGYGNTKLSNTFLESKLKVNATTRNWKTVNELLKMAGEID